MTKVVSSLALLFFSFQVLFAQTENAFHTDKKVGDTIITYGSDDGYEARLYIFMDEISCEIGFLSIEGILKTATKELNTQAIAFIKARNQAFIDKAKSEYDIRFPVVHDIATAYQRLYGVKQFPLAILTDAGGKIYHIGVPGKTYFGIQEMKEAVAEIKKASLKKSELVGLKEIGALKIELQDGTPLSSLTLRMAEYFPNDNSYLLWNHKEKEALSINGAGKVFKTVDFNRFRNTYTIVLLNNGSVNRKTIPVTDYGFDNKYSFYLANIDADTLFKIDELAETDVNRPYYKNIQVNDSIFAIGLGYLVTDNKELQKKRKSFRLYNVKSKTFKDAGRYDEIINTYPLSHHSRPTFCIDEASNIYEMQNFSDTIRVYNYDGQPIRTITCKFDSTHYNYKWKEYFAPLHEDSPQGEFMQFSDSLTQLAESQGLLYDGVKKTLHVVYSQKKYTSSGNF